MLKKLYFFEKIHRLIFLKFEFGGGKFILCFCFVFLLFHFQIPQSNSNTNFLQNRTYSGRSWRSVKNSKVKLKLKCLVTARSKTRSRSTRCPIQQKFQSLHVVGFFPPDLSNTFDLPGKTSLHVPKVFTSSAGRKRMSWTWSSRWTWSRIRRTFSEFQTSVKFCWKLVKVWISFI